MSYDSTGSVAPMAVANVSCPSCRAEPGEDCVPHAFKGQRPDMEWNVHVSRIGRYRNENRALGSMPSEKTPGRKLWERYVREAARPDGWDAPMPLELEQGWARLKDWERGAWEKVAEDQKVVPIRVENEARRSPDGGKPPKLLVDRVFEFFFGPDHMEAVQEVLEADERQAKEGIASIRKADYTVEVVYDEEAQCFGARLKTRTKDLDIDVAGETPGEALAYAGVLIDTSLVRRGFKRRKA